MMNQDNKAKAKAIYDKWPKWKKEFTITKYSAGGGESTSRGDAKRMTRIDSSKKADVEA